MTLSEIFCGTKGESIANFLQLRNNLNRKFGKDNWITKTLTDEDKKILFKKEGSYFDYIVQVKERGYYLMTHNKDGEIIHQKIIYEKNIWNFVIIKDYFPLPCSFLRRQNLPMRQQVLR